MGVIGGDIQYGRGLTAGTGMQNAVAQITPQPQPVEICRLHAMLKNYSDQVGSEAARIEAALIRLAGDVNAPGEAAQNLPSAAGILGQIDDEIIGLARRAAYLRHLADVLERVA